MVAALDFIRLGKDAGPNTESERESTAFKPLICFPPFMQID